MIPTLEMLDEVDVKEDRIQIKSDDLVFKDEYTD